MALEFVNVHGYKEVRRVIMHDMVVMPAFTKCSEERTKLGSLENGEVLKLLRIGSMISIFYSNVSWYLPKPESCQWRRLWVTNSVLSLLLSLVL